MKNNKKWFVLVESVLAVLVILCIFLMMREGSTKKMKQISVIVQNSADDRWAAFKYGAQMAAEDKNVRVSFVSTEGVLDAAEEKELILQEISDGADALIVQPSADEGTLQMLKEIENKIPVMLVENVPSEEIENYSLPYTAPDNYELGMALAQQILNSYKGNIRGKRLGICQGEMGLISAGQRIHGLEDGLRGSGIVISWRFSDTSGEETLPEQSKVDIVAAIDDRGVVAAGECVKENNLHGAVVYGIGTSVKSLYYLGIGLTEHMVVPDKFDEGYQSLAEIEQRIGNPFARMESRTTAYSSVDKTSLFAGENEKMLLILSQ